MNFSLEVVFETVLIVLEVVPRTLVLAAVILILGSLLGAVLAIIRRRKVPILTQIINILISYIRGVPLIVHLFIIRYSLPEASSSFLSIFGITTDPNEFPNILLAIIAYTIMSSATESENIRSAFQSVPESQVEAGLSIGYTNAQNMRRVILPQAMTVYLPLFLNSYIKGIKGLSLAFAVGIVEIFTSARYAAALSFRYLESYVAAALVYWIVCGILLFILRKVQSNLSIETSDIN